MSIEQPLWRALIAFRLLALAYAVFRYAVAYEEYEHPIGGWAYIAVLTAWTLATLDRVASSERCTRPFLVADLSLALSGILLTSVLDSQDRIAAGQATLPTIWAAGSVLAYAIKGGWRWGAAASVLVGVCNVVERGDVTERNLHNIILLFVASAAVGYMIELARASERTLARALQIEAATRERERLARDIHDSVLQVLAMVQRRGNEIGGEAAELGRMAGEQEAALRTLVTAGPAPAAPAVPPGRTPAPASSARRSTGGGSTGGGSTGGESTGGGSTGGESTGSGSTGGAGGGEQDLRALLGPLAGAKVSLAGPVAPVMLDAHAAREVAAAVGAALDNVRRHAGERASAWILVEEEADEVLVSVRDDGPGFPEGRLAAAEAEGRLGVAQSIRGRLRDLGGSAEFFSVPGQGAEVEMRVPRRARGGGPGTGHGAPRGRTPDGRGATR
ncbi:MacS family sensor histidine kinase [Streptomyces thermolineatus]|uniref:MacS family sensor histidine kinase n=1 Tax=Streptomyces thermolineatus TaxID=44033 RepID=UPI00384A5684